MSLSAILNYGSIINSVVLEDIGRDMPITCVKSHPGMIEKVIDGIKRPYPEYYVKELGTTLYPENYVM